MELDVSPMDSINNDMEYSNNSSETKYMSCNNNDQYTVIRIPQDGEKPNKHSSRKQSKRRKKSSNHSRPLPRIIVKPLPPPPPPENREWTAATSCSDTGSSASSRPSTMREVLASIPGFCMKPRKRSGKKLSTAAQLQQTREGCIDLETPDSILVNTNIRALLNKHTFSLLPPLYQYKLGQLLPNVDRPSTSGRLSSSSLNNEFFARACLEWQESLSGGEFTPENQQKMKTEAEKEKSKIDPWKLKHFEPFWGEKQQREKSSMNLNSERPSLKTTIKLRPTASITSSSTVPKIKKSKSSSSSKRLRSVGAVTRSSAKEAEEAEDESAVVGNKSSAPVPGLLPLKHVKSQGYIECQMDFNFSDSSSATRVEESVSSTPVDPLLLPDSESGNELKQDLDMTVVKIEESNTSKDCGEDKITDSESNIAETTKRLSNDINEYRFSKRIKYEEDLEEDNTRFLAQNNIGSESINDSDGEANYNTEQLGHNEELNMYTVRDHGDTNSEDSKATTSVYEYDEQSISSMSSLKIENHLNNVSLVTESSDNVTEYENTEMAEVDQIITVVKDDDCKDSASPLHDSQDEYTSSQTNVAEIYTASVDSVEGNKSPLRAKDIQYEKMEVIEELDYPVKQPSKEDIKPDTQIPEKNDPKLKETENIVPSYYDEHFKDAESFILETSGLPIMTTQNEGEKYTPQTNLMELTSYMSETNVTAVVTMPLSQNTSIPMMEVTNTSVVSYPDDHLQDPAKPKNSAVSWKSDSDWTQNENVITIQNFSNVNTDSAKYASEDSKTSMEDVNMNEENCMYKTDRDTNFNMESSNSSESCNSMKDVLVKQESEPATSLVSSTTAANPPINSTTMTQSVRIAPKKSKSGKESNRSRSSNKVPPGAVNLERSYQICQAVIQNSPNRDALRGQLRPPPALLTRPARPPRPPPPVLIRQLPAAVMPHAEINENRSNNMGQYILVQRTPNVAPRASSAPPSNQNTNVNVTRCRSVGADDACVCNLRAMILCKKCGAFCHDDCIGSAELCLTCLIR
ncbi:polycomb protein Asx [Maniola jurtina]|uniref:polycomb protein Asx n=1 Tax=Maniola jurtina TaxID=191418 RepID=UPI001E68AC13|nr:polycomb protein Asx [Maniola jurtina]XP_045767266.1 polycomb protein Asx [Maniola jurtina]